MIPVTMLANLPWKQIIIVAIIAGVLGSAYFKGRHDVQAKWDLEKAETAALIVKLEAASKEVTIKEVVKYVDRVKTVTQKGDTITEYVDRYLSNDGCVIPKNFVVIHDRAVKGVPVGEKP